MRALLVPRLSRRQEPSCGYNPFASTPPQAVILAGPNGAGKTTASKGLLPPGVEYVNADLIAQRLTGRSDAPGELEAMRIELAEIERLVAARESFAVKTTLAPRAFEKRIAQWRAAGYRTRLYFVYLSGADMSVQRVQMRVLRGGHDVPEDIIRRRYEEGLNNFFSKYRHLVDEWQFTDNTGNEPRPIALSSLEEGTVVRDPLLWSTLEARHTR